MVLPNSSNAPLAMVVAMLLLIVIVFPLIAVTTEPMGTLAPVTVWPTTKPAALVSGMVLVFASPVTDVTVVDEASPLNARFVEAAIVEVVAEFRVIVEPLMAVMKSPLGITGEPDTTGPDTTMPTARPAVLVKVMVVAALATAALFVVVTAGVVGLTKVAAAGVYNQIPDPALTSEVGFKLDSS